MRQDEGRRGQQLSRIANFAASSALFFSLTAAVRAGDAPGDAPDLGKPNEMAPIVSTPTTPGPTSAKPASPSRGRAVLALPGITTPNTQKPATVAPPVNPAPPADTSSGDLQLDAPSEMKGGPAPLGPLNGTPSMTPGRTQRPLVLESPDQEPVPIDGPPSRTTSPARKPTTTPRVDPQPAPPTQKRGRLFGLLPMPAPVQANSVSPAAPMGVKTTTPGRSVVESSPADLAAEAALKKRIEKQAREAVGDRVRSIDVRVEGKAAVVQARGVKLFQKRAVRKSLESIPALSGVRASIDILD